MALRDLNRYRKTYPFIRIKPVLSADSGGDVIYQSGTATVTSANSVVIAFTPGLFSSAPNVTATAYDSVPNGTANVNAYIESVSTTSVTIGFSAVFTGEVHYHAIQTGPV